TTPRCSRESSSCPGAARAEPRRAEADPTPSTAPQRRSNRRQESHQVPGPVRQEHHMPRMRAVEAAVAILEREGATQTFGVPGAAINPFYAAMRADGGIQHVLARHVEGASHM